MELLLNISIYGVCQLPFDMRACEETLKIDMNAEYVPVF